MRSQPLHMLAQPGDKQQLISPGYPPDLKSTSRTILFSVLLSSLLRPPPHVWLSGSSLGYGSLCSAPRGYRALICFHFAPVTITISAPGIPSSDRMPAAFSVQDSACLMSRCGPVPLSPGAPGLGYGSLCSAPPPPNVLGAAHTVPRAPDRQRGAAGVPGIDSRADNAGLGARGEESVNKIYNKSFLVLNRNICLSYYWFEMLVPVHAKLT
ncbi:hypothetical protein UY3_05699 [Chelonia mydas]|uniref:Uncharacterized protein n=1 Tax=Chelonia mydas TaxID=8469 RepID=M7BYK4_CHEMY|nr:hypothetical protein UY3_05699 [Chelonia mydas]